MAGERLTGIDQGTLSAECILGNGEVLRTLIAGGKDKDEILRHVVADLENDPVGQTCFLRTIFRNMAREGGLEVTNRRDAALAILTDTTEDGEVRLSGAITPLVQANPTVVHEAYTEAVQQQTRDNDPFSGSVGALLEAGKAIAPHLNQDAQTKQLIIGAWEKIAEQFPTIDERFHIRSKLEDIKQGMLPVAQLDRDVERLRNQGLSNAQIATELDKKQSEIEASAHRLIVAGRIERAPPKGRAVSQATIELDREVEQLRKTGLTNPQIAERLGRKESDIRASAHRLIVAGRIERVPPKGRAVSQATIELDREVEQLRKQGLSNRQIAEQLGKKETDVKASARRLIAAKRIERLSRGPAGSGDSAANLLRILQEFQTTHPTGSISLSEMGTQLRISRQRVRQLYEKLAATHTLPPKRRSDMKQLSQESLGRLDKEVAQRTSQGETFKQIAEELRVPSVWIETLRREQEERDREKIRNQVEQLREQGMGTIKIAEIVEQLREQGMGTIKIAEILGESRSQVGHVITGLIKAGRVQKMRQRKSQHELAPFDAQVKELRAARLTYQEIAERLGPSVSVDHILTSVRRLHRRGEIELKPSQRNKSASVQ